VGGDCNLIEVKATNGGWRQKTSGVTVVAGEILIAARADRNKTSGARQMSFVLILKPAQEPIYGGQSSMSRVWVCYWRQAHAGTSEILSGDISFEQGTAL